MISQLILFRKIIMVTITEIVMIIQCIAEVKVIIREEQQMNIANMLMKQLRVAASRLRMISMERRLGLMKLTRREDISEEKDLQKAVRYL